MFGASPVMYIQLFSQLTGILFLFILTEFQGPSSQWVDVMKKKRAVHEQIINLVHRQRSSKNEEKVSLYCAS